jgi:YhcH/YjgK/YiaL family protein
MMKKKFIIAALIVPMAIILTSCTSSEKKGTQERKSKMVFDSIKNYKLYTNLSPRMAKALEFAAKTDFTKMADGKYELDGTNLYYMVQRYKTGAPLEKIEAHRKYIDIQYIVSGSEKIGIDSIEGLKTVDPYSEEKDVEFFEVDKRLTYLNVPKGYFTIFWPGDGHMPGRQVGKPEDVTKIVFKVKVD